MVSGKREKMFTDPNALQADIARLEGFRNFLLYTQESRRMDPSTHPMHGARNVPQLTNAESAFQVLQPPSCSVLSVSALMSLCYEKLGCVAHLDFTDRQLTDKDAQFLAQFVPFLRELQSLSLLGVSVGQEGVLALSSSVQKCAKFQTLDLTQDKYKFVVKHSDVMKELSSQGCDVSWWSATKSEIENLLGPGIQTHM